MSTNKNLNDEEAVQDKELERTMATKDIQR